MSDLSTGEIDLTRPITILVKRVPGSEGLPLPVKMTGQSAGFDLAAAVDMEESRLKI